jgi:hypothetical protein
MYVRTVPRPAFDAMQVTWVGCDKVFVSHPGRYGQTGLLCPAKLASEPPFAIQQFDP